MSFLKHIKALGVDALDLTQRVLLATDGTLTDMLEAIFCERIRVEKRGLETISASSQSHVLEVDVEHPLAKRSILLVGCATGRPYVYAETLLVVSRLPASLQEALANTNTPLGHLLALERRESRKDFLVSCRTFSEGIARCLQTDRELLMRSYRVTSLGKPIMLISEWFPVSYCTQAERSRPPGVLA